MGERTELRVEDLAEEAGVTVDTVRYYQSKGLLHPPRRQGRVAWYGSAHLDRIARIKALQAKGFSLGTIARVLAGELDAADEALVGAVADQVRLVEGRLFSLDELSELTGIPTPLLGAVEREGLLVPMRVGDVEGYTADDVTAARAGLTLLQWGIPLPDLLELAAAHHRATRDIATQAVDLFDTHVRDRQRRHPPDGGPVTPARLVEAFHALLPATTTLVSHHFTRVLLQAALDHIEHVGSPDELEAVRSAELG